MDTALFKTWRDDRLQDKKNKEEAKKKEAKAASIFVVPAIYADKEAQSVVISVADSATVDIPVVNVQSIHEAIAVVTGSKPRSVSPQDWGDDVAPHVFDKEYNLHTTPILFNTALCVLDATHVSCKRIQAGYYFATPRPPENELIPSRFQPWEWKCLKEIGWGPPTCMAIRDNVQDKSSGRFYSFS
jgi:hypothetical protein